MHVTARDEISGGGNDEAFEGVLEESDEDFGTIERKIRHCEFVCINSHQKKIRVRSIWK